MIRIRRNQITLLNCTPSAFYPLTELTASKDFAPIASLRYVILGGEPISLQTVRPWLTSITCDAIVANTYGPTECTDIATFYLLDRTNVDSHDFTPIGKPIYNSKIIVVDRHLEPCPVGVPGELCIGGIGVGAGYLNNPKLTTDKFVRNPFPEIESEQLYKTGDLARYLPNGVIEYLGRLDNQVKIRGFRIELGEIETVLGGFPGVREAVVIAREDVPGDKRLVAYLTVKEGATPKDSELRGLLRAKLPEHMVPSAFVILDRFPLTPNGKLDRRALPAPGDQALGTQAYEAPEGPIETAIAAIWAEFLHLERVGRHDDFFNLGGHSLMALRVIGAINTALEVRLPVPVFFQDPSIERLAKIVEQKHHVEHEPRVVRLQSRGTGLPLYFITAGPSEHRLAQLLGEDRAIFAVDVPMSGEWLAAIAAADRAALPTMEQLGALYADVLRAHAGSSPFVLAGYSLGGKIAFEAAHALRRVGGNVGFVLLIDTGPFIWSGAIRGLTWQSLRGIWRDATSGTRSDASYLARLSEALAGSWRLFLWLKTRIPQLLKGRLHLVKNRSSSEAPLSGFLDQEGRPVDQATIGRLARIAWKSWRPRPLDASGALFRTKFPGEELLPGYDLSNGWGELFDRGLEIIQASGDHASVVSNENIAGLARQISSVLNRYETEHKGGVVRSGDETDAGRSARRPRSDQELPQTEHASIYAST